ncbi:MAG: hypothetical protein R6U98_23870 [Pirellulaceae bacterium]
MITPPTDEQLNDAFSASHEFRPTAASWGLFGYSDAPAPICGSGMGTFHWFETKTEMLEFVYDYMAWWHPAPSSMTPEEMAEKVQILFADFDASSHDLEQLRSNLNHFMQNMWQIEWWGQFKDLTDGNGGFAARIRSDFREDVEGLDGGSTAIPEDKLDDFHEYLQSYGY